jgi:hypothetical protein
MTSTLPQRLFDDPFRPAVRRCWDTTTIGTSMGTPLRKRPGVGVDTFTEIKGKSNHSRVPCTTRVAKREDQPLYLSWAIASLG